MRMLFIPPRHSSVIKPHCQPGALSGEVLVTLWVWVQPTEPRIHPSRAFFVLVCHTAAMLSVCRAVIYTCISVSVWVVGRGSGGSVEQGSYLSDLRKPLRARLKDIYLVHKAKCISQVLAAGTANQRQVCTQHLPHSLSLKNEILYSEIGVFPRFVEELGACIWRGFGGPKICNFTSFLTIIIIISVYKKLRNLEQIINKQHPKILKTKFAKEVHWGPIQPLDLGRVI